MTTKTTGLLVAALLVAGFSHIALAEETIALNLSLDYYSKYIWRGQNYNDDPVFQPSISASYGNLTSTVWGSLDLSNYTGNSGDFYELDYSLDYSRPVPGFEGVDYSIGVIYYDFPGSVIKDTTELYWGFTFDLPLSPSITVYHDVDESEGTYISLGFGHSIDKIAELGPGRAVGMEISASLGWGSGSYNKYYWGTDQSKMQDLTLAVSFPMEIGGGWTLAPSLNYVTLLSDDIRATGVRATISLQA